MPNITPPVKSAREICEDTLRAERSDLIEKKIWPSCVEIIDRLLTRGLELEDAYEELVAKLGARAPALTSFFDLLQSAAAFSNPEATAEARDERARLVEVNRRIVEIATQLSELLQERHELTEHSGFSTDTHYHPIELIDAASANNGLYNSYVKDQLDALRCRFDLKYWPNLETLVQVIADDAGRANPRPIDEVIAAGTDGARPGLADTFKVLFSTVKDNSIRNHGFLPDNFQLTDRATASLMSCALGLGPDEVVDAPFVKRLRQRERERIS